jgi:hypothetical protein
MGVLHAKCPATGKTFSTSIHVETSTIETLPQVRTRSYCPYCEGGHVWWTSDAILVDAVAAAYGVHPSTVRRAVRDGRLQYIVVDPLLFLADPNQPNAAEADRQASRAKRKFLSKSAAKQKMRASEQGWAALRSAIFRPIDHTVPVPGKSELDLALPFLGQMRRTW